MIMKFKRKQELDLLVTEVIDSFKDYSFDLSSNQGSAVQYLLKHKHEYVRTLDDIVDFSSDKVNKRVLEVGAFFGVVSISLAKLGFEVYSLDQPKAMSLTHQKKLMDYGITTRSADLQTYVMPFEDNFFDCIIMCEVLEHLNFNPLPLIKEINRIGTQGSLFYLSLPNIAKYSNRLRLLRGQSLYFPVEGFFRQLEVDSTDHGQPHWREYTTKEIQKLLEPMGYDIKDQYYFCTLDYRENLTPKNRVTKLVFNLFPSLKENQTTLAVQQQKSDKVFYIPEAWNRIYEKQVI